MLPHLTLYRKMVSTDFCSQQNWLNEAAPEYLAIKTMLQANLITKDRFLKEMSNKMKLANKYSTISLETIYNNNEYYTAKIETNGVAKTLESSNLKMVGYEVFALVFEDSRSGYLKLKNGYWLNAEEIKSKNLKLTSWTDYVVEKNTEWYAYDPGLNLRDGPSTKHNKIVTLKGDLFGIKMTNEKNGKWQKVNVKQYRKHPCSGEDNLILKTYTGWIKLISEDETPNVWDYGKGC